jgi:hypothetical protein
MLGQFGDSGMPADLVGNNLNRFLQNGFGLLHLAGHTDPTALVPEMAPELTSDGGPGEAGQIASLLGIEPSDRQDQTEDAHLPQLVRIQGRVGVLGGEPTHQTGRFSTSCPGGASTPAWRGHHRFRPATDSPRRHPSETDRACPAPDRLTCCAPVAAGPRT